MFGSKKSPEEKVLEKERKKYGTRKYGQTILKHSHMGIRSCWYAAGAFLLLASAIVAAFILRGQNVGFVGGMGILSVVLAGLGIQASVKGRREREKNYLTCKIGVLLNGIILVCLLIIFAAGF